MAAVPQGCLIHDTESITSQNPRVFYRYYELYCCWNRTMAGALEIKENHAGNVLKRLNDWGLVKRWKGKSEGGRPPYHYQVTKKGRRRLERIEAELGCDWWLLPETRSEKERGIFGPIDRHEPRRGTLFHKQWSVSQLQKRNKELRAEYLRLREQKRRETGY
mgnify:CR=1 FL=1